MTTRQAIALMVVTTLTSILYLIFIDAAHGEVNLIQLRAEESALAKLKHPINYSLPAHYLELTGERVVETSK
jgi:hypothetical protein